MVVIPTMTVALWGPYSSLPRGNTSIGHMCSPLSAESDSVVLPAKKERRNIHHTFKKSYTLDNSKGVTLVYLNTVIRWTRLTRQKSKWVDSLYLYDNTYIYACT